MGGLTWHRILDAIERCRRRRRRRARRCIEPGATYFLPKAVAPAAPTKAPANSLAISRNPVVACAAVPPDRPHAPRTPNARAITADTTIKPVRFSLSHDRRGCEDWPIIRIYKIIASAQVAFSKPGGNVRLF